MNECHRSYWAGVPRTPAASSVIHIRCQGRLLHHGLHVSSHVKNQWNQAGDHGDDVTNPHLPVQQLGYVS